MVDNKDDYYLGEVSARYESTGPGTISSGNGDKGGVSYGTYQLSVNEGTLEDYLKQSAYDKQFDHLTPETSAFNDKWRELAKTDPGFAKDQHDFIKQTHYDPTVARLKKDGLDLTGRGPAVQEALWSTSVQTRGLAPRIFEHGLKEKFGEHYKLSDLSDKDIVGAVQDYKISHNNTLFKSSPSDWPGLLDRAGKEKEDLEALADGRPLPERAHKHSAASHAEVLKEHSKGADVSALQSNLAALGYADSHGHALQADGYYGRDTAMAVESYQRQNGLPADGVAGPKTLSAIHAQRQALVSGTPAFAAELQGYDPAHRTPLNRESPMPALPEASVPPPSSLDPRHPDSPNHALYNKIQQRLPDASEQRLLQFIAVCHSQGITGQNMTGIVFDRQNGFVSFAGNDNFAAKTASVDVKIPPPPAEQSIQHIQQTDQFQAQLQIKINATIAQNNLQGPQGPTPGGPGGGR